MKGFENMICPICKEDTITIEEERVGPTGYRETEYTIIAKCDCKVPDVDFVALGIQSYNATSGAIITAYQHQIANTNNTCADCKNNKVELNHPTRAWLGEYKEICVDCFIKEIDSINKRR